MDLVIIKELKDRDAGVPEITNEMLEKQIIDAGRATCPLTVWRGKNILVDGHRRYHMCRRLNLPYSIREREFRDIEDAKAWADREHLSRRHWDPITFAKVVSRIIENTPVTAKKTERAIRRELAKQTGCSEPTIHSAVQAGQNLMKIPPDIRDRLGTTAGKDIPASRAAIAKLAKMPEREQYRAIASFDRGVFSNLGDAIKNKDRKLTVYPLKKPIFEYIREAEKSLGQTKRKLTMMANQIGDESVKTYFRNAIEAISRRLNTLHNKHRGKITLEEKEPTVTYGDLDE